MSRLADLFNRALSRGPLTQGPSDQIAAFKFVDGQVVPLTDQEYREECAKRAREWEGRDTDPGTRYGYKPSWAEPIG